MKTRFLVMALGTFGILGALFAPGCADQGEGERCDVRNNTNGDCEPGLLCVAVGGRFRCCPSSIGPNTSAECRASTQLNDAQAPTSDTGPQDAADTGVDASDSGTDAPVDAPTDTGSDADSG